MFVINQNNSQIEIIERATGKSLGSFGRPGSFPGEFNQVHGIAWTRRATSISTRTAAVACTSSSPSRRKGAGRAFCRAGGHDTRVLRRA
jgi:hypothetical protein